MNRGRTWSVLGAAVVLLAGAAAWGLVMLRADAKHDSTIGNPADYGSLTADQYAVAVRVARTASSDPGNHLTSATAVVVPGRVRRSDAPAGCLSGRLLKVRLTGRFPHTVVDHPPDTASRGPVRAVLLTAVVSTGQVCVGGVSVRHLTPYKHGGDLMPVLSTD